MRACAIIPVALASLFADEGPASRASQSGHGNALVKPKKRTSTDPNKSLAAKGSYQPTPREQSAIRKYLVRGAAEASPRVKVLNDGMVSQISLDHPDAAIGHVLLAEALGTANADFLDGLLRQLVNAGSDHGAEERGLNFMLSVIKGIKPRDQLEAMLAAQMAATHMATMTFARRLANVENIPQQDSAERAFNKLARTFTTQMEALKRYRTGGEQKVTVQHVSVSEGGQAIVGNVTRASTETGPETADSHPALTDARQTPMAIIGDPEREPAQIRRNRNQSKR
jgi:hypothetical protein